MNPFPSYIRIPVSLSMILCGLSVSVATLPSLALALDVVKIITSAKAETEGDTIRLGNIADIRGSNVALVKTLQEMEIGKAPLPGNSLFLDRHYLETRLEQGGVNMSEVIMETPDTVEVTRGSVTIPKERIEKVVTDLITAKILSTRSGVRLKGVRVDNNVVLPKGNVSYQCKPPGAINPAGLTVIPVVFRTNGGIEKKVLAYANIEEVLQVVVSKRPLRRYQIITEDDIQLQEMSTTDLPRTVITDCREVIGKRAKRALTADTVLVEDCVELPPLVKRGDIVHIIAESGSLRITAAGEVREAGCRGATVKVLNHDSRKEIYARVMDSTTVRVDF